MSRPLSKKLMTQLQEIQENAASKSQAAAVEGARMRLESQAPDNVCLTCEKANWFVYWGAGKATDEKEWTFILASCGAGISHQPNEEGLGLHMPNVPFCTAKHDDYTSGGIGHLRNVQPPVKFGTAASNHPVPRQRGG